MPVDRGGNLRPPVLFSLLLRDSDFGIWPVSAYGCIRALVDDSEDCMGHMQAEIRLRTHSTHSILAVNTAMYLSIFGPAGMMRLTTFEWLGPPMIGAVGVVSIPWVVPWWSGRHDEPSDADSRRKNSMEMPLRRGSLDERSLEESEERAERELAVCASFEESFREWQEHEKASTTTTMEETTRGCRENRDEDGG